MDEHDELGERLGRLADTHGTLPDLTSRVAERRRGLRRRRVVERFGAAVLVAAVGVFGITAVARRDDGEVVTRTPTAESTVPETTLESVPTSSSTPEPIADSGVAPVRYIAAVLDDNSLVLLDAETGAEIREIHPAPERQPMVDGVLAIGADGVVYFTTTTGVCGEVHSEHVDGGGAENQFLPTSRAVFSPDGVFGLFRELSSDCDGAPWNVDRRGLLDVPVDVVLNRDGEPLVAWTEGGEVMFSRALDLDPVPLGVEGRAEAGNWPILVVAEAGGGHRSVDLVTGTTSDLPDDLGTALAVEDGFLLALSDTGELTVVSPTGGRRVAATGVLDAAWGPTPVPDHVLEDLDDPPVGQVAVLRADGTVEVLAAFDGAPLHTVDVPRGSGSRVVDILAMTGPGHVVVTTDEGECGALRYAGIHATDSIRMPTNRVIASPDGSLLAARRATEGCDDGPWVLVGNAGTTFELDHPVDGIAVTGEDSVAVYWNDGGRVRWRPVVNGDEEPRAIDVPIDDFGVGYADPQFTLGAAADWPNVVVTSEFPNEPEAFTHGSMNVESGELGSVLGRTERVVAAHAGHLLVLDSDGRLSRVDQDGTDLLLAEGVVDAAWGPIAVPDGFTVLPIRFDPISLSGAPGDPIDIELPGLPLYGAIYLAAVDSEFGVTLGHVTGDQLRPRMSTTIPWGSVERGPVEPGRYVLRWVNWDFDPIVIGTIDITEPGVMPAPVGTPPGAIPILRPDGIGDVDFGVSREVIEPYLTDLLGSAFVFDPRYYESNMGGLVLRFSFEGTWTAWSYRGDPSTSFLLSTLEGITVGMTVGDLMAAFPTGGFGACVDALGSYLWFSGPERPRYVGFLTEDAEQVGATLEFLEATLPAEFEFCQ